MSIKEFAVVSGVMCLVMCGIALIAWLTPKLADCIDKLRGKSPDPYNGVPNPARVEDEDEADSDPTPAEDTGENQEK